MQFHISGAFELFVNHLVHAATGINQAGGYDCEATAFFNVTGAAEEFLGRVQGCRIYSSGKGPTTGGYRQIVGPGEAGNTIQ